MHLVGIVRASSLKCICRRRGVKPGKMCHKHIACHDETIAHVLRIHDLLALGSVLGIHSLQDIVYHQALADTAVTIVGLNVIIRSADAFQLVGVSVVMGAILLAYQNDGNVRPVLPEKSGKQLGNDEASAWTAEGNTTTYSSSNSSTKEQPC